MMHLNRKVKFITKFLQVWASDQCLQSQMLKVRSSGSNIVTLKIPNTGLMNSIPSYNVSHDFFSCLTASNLICLSLSNKQHTERPWKRKQTTVLNAHSIIHHKTKKFALSILKNLTSAYQRTTTAIQKASHACS